MNTHNKPPAAVIWWLIVGLLSLASVVNAQYSQTICDSTRLLRCQQEVLRDMQMVSLNSASIQYPINSGPPYSPSSGKLQQHQLATVGTCRLVRSNLDCLLAHTPSCYEQGIQAAQNTDVLFRAKRFLEQNGCNEPDTTWSTSLCYRSPEIRSCEERYGFTNSFAAGSLTNNVSACLAYQAFKHCIESHLRFSCKVHEMDMANEYLIDRASDLAWRCPTNSSSSSASSSGAYGYNQPASLLSPISNYNNQDAYVQRPTYVASTGNNLFGGPSAGFGNHHREQAWERFTPLLDNTRGGISRFPNGDFNGLIFDRLQAGNLESELSSDCPVKAAPYARECENTLLGQQRLAHDSRDGNELQRRACCALFQYRDCISRVVLDRCADSSPTAVEILMGVRRREMTLSCRLFNRDVCSGSMAQAALNLPLVLAAAIIITCVTLKQALL